MKSFGGLFERIVAPASLEAAMWRACRGKMRRAPTRRFVEQAAVELPALARELVEGSYVPRPYTQFRILDPKPRLISCADFRDRVVHHALCGVIGPILERRFIDDSFACRTGKGSHRAVLRARHFARRFEFFWKGDIRRFYDNVEHVRLLAMTDALFREQAVRDLIRRIVLHPCPGQAAGRGLPIGNLTSQWLANSYLDKLDHFVKEVLRLPGYVRYMDDFVAWHASKEALFDAWSAVADYARDQLGLELKAEATRVAPCADGVPFLGFRVFPGCLRLQGTRKRRMWKLMAARERQYSRGELSSEKLAQCVASSVGIVRFFGLSGLWPSAVEA